MKILLRFALLGILAFTGFCGYAQALEIYAALSSSDLRLIDQQLQALEGKDGSANAAYEGALLMKKAGLIRGAGKKLEAFKNGREKLEKAIESDPDNGEYRFLRLMIQEHAPDMLGYNKSIEEDSAIVVKQYASLKEEVKNAVQNYSRESKALKGAALK